MPGRKLNEFINFVKTDGFALSAHFAVSITPPDSLFSPEDVITIGNDIIEFEMSQYSTLENIWMLCEQVTLPGMSLLTSPIRTTGEIREVPYEKTFDPIQLVFLLDINLRQKLFFDRWFDLVHCDTNKIFEFPENYLGIIDIFSIDRNNGRRLQTRLFDAFPKTLGTVNLDHNSKDIARLPVILSYKYYRTFYFDGQPGDAPVVPTPGNGFYNLDSVLNVDLMALIQEFQASKK